MTTVSLSFRVSPEKAEKLERLAKAMDRNKSWLLEKALDSYLRDELAYIEGIYEALDELERGEGVPHEKVMEWLDTWGKDETSEPPV